MSINVLVANKMQINILVGTGQGVRLFSQRIYEVNVLENQLAPLVLIDLNSTDEMIHQPVQYSIVGTDHRGELSLWLKLN